MADTLYTLGASKLLTGDIDWDSHVIKCALVDTGSYTPDFDADEFLSDLSAAVVATSSALTNKAVTAGVATADDAVFTSVSGSTVEALVIYKDTGVDTTSSLLAYVDSSAGLPYTPTGSGVSFSWAGGVVFYLSGLQPTLAPTVVADETERLSLIPSDGELVWQTDTNELYVYADAATPSWERVYPAGDTQLSIDNPDLWGTNLGYDEEFNDFSSSLPSGWAWKNQSTSTYSESFGKGVVVAPAAAGIHWRGIVRPVPTPSSYELITKMSWNSRSGNESATGIGFTDSGTKLLSFYWYSLSGTSSMYLVSWTDLDGGGPSVKSGPITPSPIGMPTYLRIRKNSATSYDFAFSPDGVMWYTLVSGYDVSAILTPTHVGFLSYNSASYAWNQGFNWFRVRDIGWTPTP
jgi:hypothetical protein